MNLYQFTAKDYQGKPVELNQYKGKVVLVVNTAIHCGLATQYKGLEKLYKQYQKQGFDILDFPSNQFANQSPENDKETAQICQLKFKNSFKPFAKIDVNGKNADPVFRFLKNSTWSLFGRGIKWNFTKFLVDRKGRVIKRYAPVTKPEAIEDDIRKAL
jgi:glutathione peroxidase